MKKYIFLFAFIPSLLIAQNNGDSLKFEIIKSTINFLTSDSISYKALKGKLLKCDNLDYSCITDYCKKNNVGSIQKKVDEWKKAPSSNADDLQKLVIKIVNDLSIKEHRKKLDSFKKFLENANQLISIFKESTIYQDSKAISSIESSSEDQQSMQNSFVNDEERNSVSKLPFIALLLSIVAIVLSILTFLRTNTKFNRSVEHSNSSINLIKEQLNDVRNITLKKNLVDLMPLQKNINDLESRIAKIEEESPIDNLSDFNQTSMQAQKEVPITATTNFIKYARYPDMIEGFTNGSLGDNQNGEMVFEILINGNSAFYCVTDDSESQTVALSDYKNYLSNACDIINQPSKGCKIITLSKGTLLRSGSNWIIQTKAKIEFR